MIWCPYTNRDICESSANSEHIIPLSLGGSNQFTILVDKAANSTAGSEIDAAISNNFLTLLKRQAKGLKGHSGKRPKATLKHSRLGKGKKPVQATLGDPSTPILLDPMTKKHIPDEKVKGMTFESTLQFGFYDDVRFVAKVSLASGYYIYGDYFRKYAAHNELRMLLDIKNYTECGFTGNNIRVSTRFSNKRPEDKIERDIQIESCASIDGACVITQLTTASVWFTVGIMGDWIGTLCVPADIEHFPYNEEEYDLGHVVRIDDRNVSRMSYRHFLETLMKRLEIKHSS